ncbi:MAG: hypothetical protein ACI9VS_000053, partial [Candidatus Binatia bacterium]
MAFEEFGVTICESMKTRALTGKGHRGRRPSHGLIGLAIAVAAVLLAFCVSAQAAKRPDRPNIVLLFADDL